MTPRPARSSGAKTLIPRPGEPGDETWAGSLFETRWMTGVWGQLTYDPELDLVFFGSSGVGPASEAQRNMPGATMAGTNTRFAVRPKTGEIVWKHQVLPRDNWDQECTFEMMIINTPVNPDPAGMLAVNPDARRGPRKTLTGVPCKTGIAWSFDAATGEFLWAKPTVEQNLVARIDPKGLVTVNEDVVLKEVGKTYHICPTYNGGRDWPQGAYNPRSNVMYMPLSNLCIDSTARTDRGRGAAVRLQHDQRRQVRNRQGQGRAASTRSRSRPARPCGAGRRGSRTTRRSWRPAAASCSTAPWTGTCGRSMPITDKSCGRRGFPRKRSAAP